MGLTPESQQKSRGSSCGIFTLVGLDSDGSPVALDDVSGGLLAQMPTVLHVHALDAAFQRQVRLSLKNRLWLSGYCDIFVVCLLRLRASTSPRQAPRRNLLHPTVPECPPQDASNGSCELDCAAPQTAQYRNAPER